MKSKFPTQLILLLFVTILAATGWIYTYSCRDEINMDLRTLTGDASSLADKEFDIQFASTLDRNAQGSCDLDIRFSSGPSLENITYAIEKETPIEYELSLFRNLSDSGEGYAFKLGILGSSWTGIITELQIKGELPSMPGEYNPEDSITEQCFVVYSGCRSRYVEMDGIVYFTIRNFECNFLKYKIWLTNKDRYNSHAEFIPPNPVEYTALSGIWAVDKSSGEPPENLVPYVITGDVQSSKVYEIYAAEAESSIVLLTVENGVDLYATVYDTKTKKTHEPVLIFHSDSGDIIPIISRENNTCPMGSIIVEIQNDERECYAVALKKNEVNGSIEPVYENPQNISTNLLSLQFEESLFWRYSTYSEIFYCGDEMWIIGDYLFDWFYQLDRHFTQDNPNYPYSSQYIEQIQIMGIKEGDIFYSGILNIDLTAVDIDAKISYHLGYDYSINCRGNSMQIEMY